MGIYFSHPSGGPCWSRDLGYHTPKPLPTHIMRIITSPRQQSWYCDPCAVEVYERRCPHCGKTKREKR